MFQYALRHCDILCIELLSDLGLLMWALLMCALHLKKQKQLGVIVIDDVGILHTTRIPKVKVSIPLPVKGLIRAIFQRQPRK